MEQTKLLILQNNYILLMKILLHIFLTFNLILLLNNNTNAQLLDSAALSNAREYKSLKEALEKPSEVYRLNLQKKKLTKFPMEILKLVNLNELNLSHNKIVKIPPEIAELEYLQRINLSKNELTSIPTEIASLKNVEVLILNRNNIQTLPLAMGKMYSLKVLDIWGTEIDELPYEISGLKHTLQKLDMRVIYMTRAQQNEILKWFPLTEVLFSRACNCQ